MPLMNGRLRRWRQGNRRLVLQLDRLREDILQQRLQLDRLREEFRNAGRRQLWISILVTCLVQLPAPHPVPDAKSEPPEFVAVTRGGARVPSLYDGWVTSSVTNMYR